MIGLNRAACLTLGLVAVCFFACSGDQKIEPGLQPLAEGEVAKADATHADLEGLAKVEAEVNRAEVPETPAPQPETSTHPVTQGGAFLWGDLQFELPDGLPATDKPRVIVHVESPRAMKGQKWGPIEIQTNGHCRVAMPKGAKRAKLSIQSDFLYFPYEPTIQVEEGEVKTYAQLRMQLGALVKVEVQAPDALDLQKVEVAVGGGNSFQNTGGWPKERQGGPLDSPDHEFKTASLDRDGTFHIPAMRAHGRQRISARAPGYAWRNRTLEREDVPPGSTQHLVIQLEPGYTLRSTTKDDAGNPIENVSLTLHRQLGDMEQRGFEPWREAHAEKGTWDWEGLPVGSYLVSAKSPGYLDGGAMIEFNAAGDKVVESEFTLHPARGISGHVVWADGTPVPDATVTVRSYAAQNARVIYDQSPLSGDLELQEASTTQSDQNGKFTIQGFQDSGELKVHVKGLSPHFKVPDGTKKLAARKLRREAQVMGHFTGIVMGASDLRLELEDGGGLSGLVTDDRGIPLEDFKIAVYSTGTVSPKDNRRIRFDSDIARESPAHSKRFRKTAGQFRLPNLSNGEWGLRITSKNHTHAWVSPVRSGTTDLKFALTRHAGLEGSVVDSSGQGLEEGRVEVKHTDSGEVFTSYLSSRKPGEFTIPNITAGRCTVRFTSGRGDPKANPIELELSPGERRIDYVIPCHPPGAIHGVVDMEWYTGSGKIRGEGPMIQETPISSRGLFRLDDMPAGTYQVQFTAIPKDNARHRPGWSKSVVVAPGKTTDIQLGPFGKGMRWTGQVQVEGRELGRATVRFVSLRGLHDVYEAPLDALGQFSIHLPSDSDFAVLVIGFGTHWFRNPWFLLDEKFGPEPDQPGSWTLSTSRFQLNCVDSNGNQVHWMEDSPASDIRFVPDSVPDNSDYIAGHVLKGRFLPSVLPGSRYNVSGFVKDKAGRAWRVKGEQSFVAPANGETREVTIVLIQVL